MGVTSFIMIANDDNTPIRMPSHQKAIEVPYMLYGTSNEIDKPAAYLEWREGSWHVDADTTIASTEILCRLIPSVYVSKDIDAAITWALKSHGRLFINSSARARIIHLKVDVNKIASKAVGIKESASMDVKTKLRRFLEMSNGARLWGWKQRKNRNARPPVGPGSEDMDMGEGTIDRLRAALREGGIFTRLCFPGQSATKTSRENKNGKQPKVVKESTGPRGGKIIGKTSSGKPVYAPHRALVFGKTPEDRHKAASTHLSRHTGFTSKDHEDAAEIHRKESDRYHSKKERGNTVYGKMARAHGVAAYHHKKQSGGLNHESVKESSVKKGDKVRVTVKKVDGEWQAQVYVNGKYSEGLTYFSGADDGDGKEDVTATAADMRKRFEKQGCVVEAAQKPAVAKPSRTSRMQSFLAKDRIKALDREAAKKRKTNEATKPVHVQHGYEFHTRYQVGKNKIGAKYSVYGGRYASHFSTFANAVNHHETIRKEYPKSYIVNNSNGKAYVHKSQRPRESVGEAGMKIQPEHYKTLVNALKAVKAAHPKISPQSYAANKIGKDTAKRFRWDALHAAKFDVEKGRSWVNDVLYKYMDDNHIDTALKKAVKDVWGVSESVGANVLGLIGATYKGVYTDAVGDNNASGADTDRNKLQGKPGDTIPAPETKAENTVPSAPCCYISVPVPDGSVDAIQLGWKAHNGCLSYPISNAYTMNGVTSASVSFCDKNDARAFVSWFNDQGFKNKNRKLWIVTESIRDIKVGVTESSLSTKARRFLRPQ